MEMLQLYVVYDERLKPVDSNIGSFNRYNHKIDRINIEINEALPEHIFSLNVKRPDGTVNLLGYEVVQVDGTNYYFDVPAWVTEEDGLVEFSLVASTLSQVISFGKFYVDCIDTLQATAQATPDDPTFLSKVDKDLSTYEEVTAIANAFMFVDNDGEPEKIEIVSGDIETDVVLWTGGKIKSELDLKQDVITDNSIRNDLLAQMPTMTIKGNDTGATANAKDLTVVEVMELLSPSGLMEVPHNLKVYGDIEQVGGSYETHQEQVYTTKDHIILRDGAVGGLGTGSYAGLFAKLADGTNNAGLVFDGGGMARVGDIGTNLASPDFSQTQALATREDSPQGYGIPYWDATSKSFKTYGSNGTYAPLRIAINNSILVNNRDVATSNVPALTIYSWTDVAGKMQGYYQYNGTTATLKASVEYSGKFTSDVGFSGLISSDNGLVDTNNNIIISRNLGDSVAALTVDQKHASSTGKVQEWKSQGVTKAWMSKDGDISLRYVDAYALRNIDDPVNANIETKITGTVISRNINDANPALIVNEQQGTGNIANFQFGGANKLEVTKDGWLFQNGTRLLHTFSHPTGSTAIPTGQNVFIGQEAGNLTMGSTATSTSEASYNVGVGYRALVSNTTGSSNTAIGMEALRSNTTGSYNTAIGMEALRFNTTGSNNTANGMQALRSNSTGSSNAANGYAALYSNTTGSYNIAIGVNTLRSNTTGSYNTAIGMEALRFNTTGTNNIGNGIGAGRYFGSGTSALTIINNSIFIGVNSRANADNETNEIVIGYEALGKGSNTATIGNSSITDYYFNANTNATSRFGNIRFGSITNGAIGDIPATINAITGTTANLLSLQVNGVEKASFDKDGILTAGITYDNATSGLTATSVKGAIDELAGLVDGIETLLASL